MLLSSNYPLPPKWALYLCTHCHSSSPKTVKCRSLRVYNETMVSLHDLVVVTGNSEGNKCSNEVKSVQERVSEFKGHYITVGEFLPFSTHRWAKPSLETNGEPLWAVHGNRCIIEDANIFWYRSGIICYTLKYALYNYVVHRSLVDLYTSCWRWWNMIGKENNIQIPVSTTHNTLNLIQNFLVSTLLSEYPLRVFKRRFSEAIKDCLFLLAAWFIWDMITTGDF